MKKVEELHPQKEEEKANEEVAPGIDIEAKPEIYYDDFMKMQFQVGEIIACEEAVSYTHLSQEFTSTEWFGPSMSAHRILGL